MHAHARVCFCVSRTRSDLVLHLLLHAPSLHLCKLRSSRARLPAGEWRGLPVAIKVVLLQEGDSTRRRERLVREVALAVTLSHANVVPTFHYT